MSPTAAKRDLPATSSPPSPLEPENISPTINGPLSSLSLRRSSAISLSSLHHRAPFPLKLDLSSVIGQPFGSPVTLAPKTGPPRSSIADLPPDFLSVSAFPTSFPAIQEVIDLTDSAAQVSPVLGTSDRPINVDIDMDMELFGPAPTSTTETMPADAGADSTSSAPPMEMEESLFTPTAPSVQDTNDETGPPDQQVPPDGALNINLLSELSGGEPAANVFNAFDSATAPVPNSVPPGVPNTFPDPEPDDQASDFHIDSAALPLLPSESTAAPGSITVAQSAAAPVLPFDISNLDSSLLSLSGGDMDMMQNLLMTMPMDFETFGTEDTGAGPQMQEQAEEAKP